MMGTIRWPSVCPCCASRKLLVWQETGEWWCCGCWTDSADVKTPTTGGRPHHANRTIHLTRSSVVCVPPLKKR